MNKRKAKEIAQSGITVGQIKQMLREAKAGGDNNINRSVVNKGMTKAHIFKILWGAYIDESDDDIIGKSRGKRGIGAVIGATNAIWEFGDYWEER